MSENRQKLTVRSVEFAPVGFTWDSVLPSFGPRVLESGRRSFVIRYRTQSVSVSDSVTRLWVLPFSRPAF